MLTFASQKKKKKKLIKTQSNRILHKINVGEIAPKVSKRDI